MIKTRRLFWQPLLSLLFCILLAAGCRTGETGPEAVLEDYETAHNAHDLERILSLVTDDVQFHAGSLITGTGKERLVELSAWDKAVNSRMEFEVVEVFGDTVICRVTEENDWYKGLGIPYIEHEGSVFVIRDGRIAHVISNPSPIVRRRISAGLAALKQWSDEQDDPEFDRLMSGGIFQYTPEAAASWKALFERRHASAGLDFVD